MSEFTGLGKILILAGAVLIGVGLPVCFADRIPFLGRLPGDIRIEHKGFGIYLPVATCLVVSVVVTVILNLISRR